MTILLEPPEKQRWQDEWETTPIPSARRETDAVRYHRAVVGLGARTFREGFSRGGRDALRRVWCALPAEHRSVVTGIAADYEDDADD
jgi:hypothetical protein